MRNFAITVAFTALAAAAPACAKGTAHVKAHVTKSGVYVPAHERTTPNATKADNWSSKGNVNPRTGKAGTKDPYKP